MLKIIYIYLIFFILANVNYINGKGYMFVNKTFDYNIVYLSINKKQHKNFNLDHLIFHFNISKHKRIYS